MLRVIVAVAIASASRCDLQSVIAMKTSPFMGLLLAPLVPAAAAGVLVGFNGLGFDYDSATAVAFGCIAGGYISAFCIGWPLLKLWRRLNWTGPLAGVALGVVAAACLAMILAVTFAPLRGNATIARGFFNLLTFATAAGASAGLAFWWLSMRNSKQPRTSHPEWDSSGIYGITSRQRTASGMFFAKCVPHTYSLVNGQCAPKSIVWEVEARRA